MSLTTIDVSFVIETLAAQEGLNVEVDGIDDVCYGMVISSDKTFGQWARQHAAPYNYQIVDGDPIRCVRRAVNSDLTIDFNLLEADCIRRNGGAALSFSRVEPSALPRQIEIQYIDPERDYATTTQVARHTAAPTTNTKMSIPLDFVISAQQARDMAFDLLYRIWSQQLSIQFEYPSLAIEPGDTIQLTTNGGNVFTTLVNQATINMPMRTTTVSATILLTEKGTTIVTAPEADPAPAPITPEGPATASAAGVSATSQIGTIIVTTTAGTALPQGVHATSSVGSASVSIHAGPSINGVSATGSVGAITVHGKANVTLTGVSSTSAAGDPTVTVTFGGSTVTFTAAGAGSYTVPGGASTMVAEAWGGGGAGGGGGSSTVPSGGGGGYSKFSTSVTPGQTIYYTVGAGVAGNSNSAGVNASNSWVNPSSNAQPSSNGCVGGGGNSSTTSAPGSGGAGTIGTTNHTGGTGAQGGNNGGNVFGGGGGGGAGSSANGGTGTGGNSGGTHGAGGAPDGGNGGDGTHAGNGGNGVQPGGGGGGGNQLNGGNGADGQVKLTFT